MAFAADILPALIAAFVAAVVAALALGILSMALGGDFNARWGNRLMRLRVIFQGLAVALLAILAYLGFGGAS